MASIDVMSDTTGKSIAEKLDEQNMLLTAIADKDGGLVDEKIKELRLQALIDKSVSLNSVELVKGDTNALRFLNPNTLDTPKSVTKNEKYFGYVEVNTKYLNLTVGKQYIMFVHLNISDVGGTDPVSKTLVAQHKFGTDYQGLNATYNNLQEGDNYIAMVFTPDGKYNYYGIYFDRTYNTSFTLTVKEVRVYEMDKSTETVIPENFTSALLDKPYYEKTDKDEYNLYGAVVQEVNLLKPYPILYHNKLYAAHWDGVYNGYLRIYSAGYFQGFEDRISSIEAASTGVNEVNSSLIIHTHDTKNPHKVTAGQTGAYDKAAVDEKIAEVRNEVAKDKLELTKLNTTVKDLVSRVAALETRAQTEASE